MQIIGLAPAYEAAGIIAARSMRPTVSEWADRVVRRHLRRTPTLHRRLTDVKAIRAAAGRDGLSAEVADKIVSAFRGGDEIFAPDKDALYAFLEHALDTMDFMESLSMTDRRIRRIERLSWADAEKMSEQWHASLARVRAKSKDIMEGVRKISELPDGSFFCELTTATALMAEGGAMGHCVGGYWNRVESGDIRIVSLRDANGQPHVTIELKRPNEVHIEGRGNVRLMSQLYPGANLIVPTDIEWFASQIRGKRNMVPVPKYTGMVLEWLRAASIPSREEGFDNLSADGIVIYAVERSKGHYLTEDADAAFSVASKIALERISSGAITPGAVMRTMRIGQIIAGMGDIEPVETFVKSAVANVMSHLERARNKGDGDILRYFVDCGIEVLVSGCIGRRSLPFDPLGDIKKLLMSFVEGEEVATRALPMIDIPSGSILEARIHMLPCLGLSMLNSGRAVGMEDRILSSMEPNIRKIVSAMKTEPCAYHVVRSSVQGIKKNDILQAFFACGLGQEYAVAAAQVQSNVKFLAKSMLMEAKKARVSGKNANVAFNLLADGYEERLRSFLSTQFAGDPLIIGPEKSKPEAPTRLSPTPVMKTYVLPRR